MRDTGALSLARAHTQIHSSQTERKAKRRAQPLRGGEREGPGKALAEKSQSGEHHQPEVVFPPISQYHPNLKKRREKSTGEAARRKREEASERESNAARLSRSPSPQSAGEITRLVEKGCYDFYFFIFYLGFAAVKSPDLILVSLSFSLFEGEEMKE